MSKREINANVLPLFDWLRNSWLSLIIVEELEFFSQLSIFTVKHPEDCFGHWFKTNSQ
jgi:hypothetical protein